MTSKFWKAGGRSAKTEAWEKPTFLRKGDNCCSRNIPLSTDILRVGKHGVSKKEDEMFLESVLARIMHKVSLRHLMHDPGC